MKIEIIKEHFTVCKVDSYDGIAVGERFVFTGATDGENSLVCPTEKVPPVTLERDDGWRAFRLSGILDFSLIGIMSKIASILAENGISIFAVSTYNTDYVFVKEECFDKALTALSAGGYEISHKEL